MIVILSRLSVRDFLECDEDRRFGFYISVHDDSQNKNQSGDPRRTPNRELHPIIETPSREEWFPKPGVSGTMAGGRAAMQIDLDQVRDNAAKATTADLLDRATVFRSGMEPAALTIIERELFRRGIGPGQIEAHALARSGTPRDRNDLSVQCTRCRRPAVWRGWALHKLWGILPLFPRRIALCADHLNEQQLRAAK